MVMTLQSEEKAIVSAQVDLETRDELRRRAREADRTVSAEVRLAIGIGKTRLLAELAGRAEARRYLRAAGVRGELSSSLATQTEGRFGGPSLLSEPLEAHTAQSTLVARYEDSLNNLIGCRGFSEER